jgi:phosphotransferase system enzyme I (PtsI)
MSIKGIGASPGIAIGKALVIRKTMNLTTGIPLLNETEVQQEIEKFVKAVKAAVVEVEMLKATRKVDSISLDILEVQVELLQDEQIKADVLNTIVSQNKNANDSVIDVIASTIDFFKNMKDEYFSARAADVEDAGNRILRHINGLPADVPILNDNTIIIAEDIAPSDTITIDARVIAFATKAGSKTSHAAIIAKAKGLPAVVGCGRDLEVVKTNDTLIIDGSAGLVIVNPPQDVTADYIEKKNAYSNQSILLNAIKDVKAITTDGIEITLLANISNAADMEASIAFGAEGSGLLRTEMLFMSRTSFPGEEEQFEFYKDIAIKAKGKPVIVRTLDIGGDKQLPYFNLPQEQNPFLGYRAIRISLDRKDIFITQLKAILRAGAFGNLKIMFPMISNVQEIRHAKAIVEEVKKNLASNHIALDKDMKLGIMIEIPSAAITADILAKEVDFFSIGTNDLCQYTLAVDRMNEKVKHLYDPFNPGVLRLIQNVIEQGNKHNIHTGMCGELAGDVSATLLLMGMGLREFSMSATTIPHVKNTIIRSSIAEAKKIHQYVMALDNSEAIINYLQSEIKI